MLANLDNEVHFKHVFTDVEVFTEFSRDILGIDLQITKVETEKVLPNSVSAIKFKMDLFAEDKTNRIIVEIQKVDYDYTYDRFAHYFLGNLIDTQRSSKDYSFAKDVYIIVVVTSAYRMTDKHHRPIKEDVLLTDINPRNLDGQVCYMHDHKLVILNTTNVTAETPENIKDWLDLIKESMQNPTQPKINLQKKGIAKAAQLATTNLLTPEQLAEAKEQEMRKAAVVFIQDRSRQEGIQEEKDKGIQKALKRGKLTLTEIAEDFEVSLEYVKQLAKK